MAMAKLGLFILFVGLVYFPNPSGSLTNEDYSRASCLGVEHLFTEANKGLGGYRRTIGSGLFYEANPYLWKQYDIFSKFGSWQERGNYDDPLQVELYWIKADGRILNGWVHVVVKHTEDRNFGILQMHGVVDYTTVFESFQPQGNSQRYGRGGFGEFVHDFPSCTDDQHKGDLKLSKYQFMPCGGIPGLGQTMPWGFEYVEPKEGSESGYLVPPGEWKHKEFHMTFRFSTQPCNHPSVIRIAAIAYFPEGSPNYGYDYSYRYGITDDLYLKDDHVVGAADPVPRPGTYVTLDCSTRINSSLAPKYVDAVRLLQRGRNFPAACTEAATKKPFDTKEYGETNLFGGRCKYGEVNQGGANKDWWTPDRAATTRINECTNKDDNKDQKAKDPSTQATAVEYNKHIVDITKNIASLCAPCPTVPPRPVTTERTSPTTTSRPSGAPKDDLMKEEFAELKRGVELIGSNALEIWDTRLLHGICMTILSIFVSPINIFITRYFKETFMDTRIMFLRLWYFVHHSAMMASAILYGAGLWRVVSRRILAGVSLSLSATLHRSFGWASIGIVILLAILGGFRPIERKLRTYVIAAHWTLGMTIYFMNYALMINAAWIPASPSAWVESSDDSLGKLVVPVLVILWILFDVVMHVLMTIHVCSMDKRLGLTRPRYWLPVPISVLPEDETRDLIGSWHRKKMLVVYGVVSLVVTVVICCLLGTSDPKGRGLGLMSCTHTGRGEYWQETGKKRC